MPLSFITHVSKVPLNLTCGKDYKHFVPPQREVPVLLVICLFSSVSPQPARLHWLTSEPWCSGNIL